MPPFDIRRLGPSDLSITRQLNALFDDPDTYDAAQVEDAWTLLSVATMLMGRCCN
jgi:hypothetical protein